MKLLMHVCLIIIFLMVATTVDASGWEGSNSKSDSGPGWGTIASAGAGIALFTMAPPLVLPWLGFGTGGIAAGSIAATLHSLSATTGIGAGLVAASQSAGAAGIAATTYAGLTATGAAVGVAAKKALEDD